MPRDLFGDVTRPSIAIGSRKWYTVPASLISHSLVVAALLLAPILAPALMPRVMTAEIDRFLIAVTPPAPPLPPRRADARPPVNPDAAPIEAPSGIVKEPEIEPGFEAASAIDVGTVVGTTLDAIVEPPVVKPAPPPEPLRVGSTIRTPVKIRDVAPAYPRMAIEARIEGVVILEATIGVDGSVLNLRVLRSLPLLEQPAIDAVRQWQFTPTLLNGVPVPVIMTVTVRFTLSR
jgi:protein TonB